MVVELEEELTNAGFEITQKLLRTIYSQFEGKLVAFTGKDADKFPKQSVPLSTLSSTQMPLIKTLVNDFNYKTKQLSSIENDLLHRHVSGALETFSLYFD